MLSFLRTVGGAAFPLPELDPVLGAEPARPEETAPFETPDTTRTQITLAHTFLGHVASPMEFTVTVIPPHR